MHIIDIILIIIGIGTVGVVGWVLLALIRWNKSA